LAIVCKDDSIKTMYFKAGGRVVTVHETAMEAIA